MTVSDNRPRDSAGRYAPWNTPDGRAPQPKPPRRSPSEREADRAAKKQAKEAADQKQQADREAKKRQREIETVVVKAAKKSGGWGALWDLIALSIHAGICIYAVEQTNEIADTGFAIRSNAQAITAAFDSCVKSPIACLQGKYLPQFRWGKPTDNITAMLDLVAWAEGTNDRYDMAYTGAAYTDFSSHPKKIHCSAGICSDAAGRYQMLSTTWEPIATSLKLPDFSPASQDKAAIELMRRNNCYSAAVRGDVAAFADRCWGQWASLQSAKGQKLDSRQRAHSIETLKGKYQEFLGGANEITPPLTKMALTSPMAPNRINPATGKSQPHNGADYACALGEIVRAPIGGTFRRGNSDPNGFGDTWGSIEGEGQTVTIGHTRKLLITDGAVVGMGSPIAECGSEGISTGPHLHVEIRRQGQLIDPAAEFKSN